MRRPPASTRDSSTTVQAGTKQISRVATEVGALRLDRTVRGVERSGRDANLAFITKATKQQVERYAQAHGDRLQALRELPANLVIPPRRVVTVKSSAAVAARIKKRRRQTKAMRDLLAGRPVENEP